MIGLDTNILVRFLTLDDPHQSEMVKKSFLRYQKEKELLYVSNVVILELLYVLESVYNYEREDIVNAIQSLLKIHIIKFENDNVLSEFIMISKKVQIELADLFVGLISKHAGCKTTITFDKKTLKSDYFTLLK